MFPGQRGIPVANQRAISDDTERLVDSIVSLAEAQLENDQRDRRHAVFPLFMSGIATARSDAQVSSLRLIKAYEGSGIGRNTSLTRRLLEAVYDEQRRIENAGGRREDVDWLVVARERSLSVVNCGF